MMKQPDPRKRHNHMILVAGLNHMVVPDRAAGLGNILYAAFVGPLDIVPKGEEGVGAQGHVIHLV